MWLDSKAVNCPQKWGNFRELAALVVGRDCDASGWIHKLRCVSHARALDTAGRRAG